LTDIITTLRKLRPDNKTIPDPPEIEGCNLSKITPSKRAELLLQSFFGMSGWTDFEKSIADGIEDMIEKLIVYFTLMFKFHGCIIASLDAMRPS
jgi:hypothetical protein